MITKKMVELIVICIVALLIVFFVVLYSIGTKKRKNLKAAIKNTDNLYNNNNKDFDEIVEQLQIINAQLDLMFELSLVFIVCYDYARNYFYISENGRSQLGYDISDESGESDQKKFESLIHENDLPIYGEVTDFEDIRKHEIAESPYVIKIKNAETETFGEYLMRVKPIYDEDGINKALVAAFINTEYIANK